MMIAKLILWTLAHEVLLEAYGLACNSEQRYSASWQVIHGFISPNTNVDSRSRKWLL